jgi:hypothetical protein
MIEGAQWNAVRLGQYAYYSSPVVIDMLARLGLKTLTARRFPLCGGTVLLAASRGGAVDAAGIDAVCSGELAAGVLQAEAISRLQDSVERTASGLRGMLVQERREGRTVYGYSASPLAVSLLNLSDIDASLLRGVADASPAKQGRRLPGTDVPIISPTDLAASGPDLVLVFASDLAEEARSRLPEVEARGGRWIIAEA